MGICPEAFPFFGAGTFINLSDSPEEYTLDDAGKVIRVNQTFDGVVFDHLGIEDLEDVDSYDSTDAGKPARIKSDGSGVEWSHLAFKDLTDTPGTLEAGKYPKVNEGATALEWADAGQATEHYKLGPTPNRFLNTAARDTHAQDRANEEDWLQEYIDDGTNLLRVVDTSTDPETVEGFVEPTKTTTDNTVFDRTAIPDVRSSFGLQVSGGKYYVTFTGTAGPNDLKSLAEGKPATDRLILKDTSEDAEAIITGVTISRQRAQQSVWGESLSFNPGTGTATYTFPAQSVVTAIELFDETDPVDASRRVFRIRLTVGTGSTGQTNARTLNTLFDNIASAGSVPGATDARPARITFSQGSGGNVRNHNLRLGVASLEDNTIGGTTTHYIVLRVEGIHTNTAGAPASGTAINTGWDITANFLSDQYRTIYTLEGDDQTPFSAPPGPNDWDIVDRDISVAWRKLAGTGVGNTVYTDATLEGDGSSEAEELRVTHPLPNPSGGDPGHVVARNTAGTGYELVEPATGGGGGAAGEDNIVYATASKTYNATETNELSGKIVYAMADGDITLTFSDPGATSDRGFIVVNMGANDGSVTLTATPSSERSHTVILQSPGDAATCTWDESADQWEFIEMGAVLEITSDQDFGSARVYRLRDRVLMCRNTSNIRIRVRTPSPSIAMAFFVVNASPNGSNVLLTTNTGTNRDRNLTSTAFGQTIVATWDTTNTEWKWQGNWEFNQNPSRVTEGERDAGSGTEVRGFAPFDVKDMIDTHATGGTAGDGFDLYEDVAIQLSAAPAATDRLLLADVSATGQPNVWARYDDFKGWVAGAAGVQFITGSPSWQPGAGAVQGWDNNIIVWTGPATTLRLPASLGGADDYEFLIANRGSGSITYGSTTVRVGEDIRINWTGSTTSYASVLITDREGSGGGSAAVHFVRDDATWTPNVATVRGWDDGIVVWTGNDTTLTLPSGMGSADRTTFLLADRGAGNVTNSGITVREGEDMRFWWDGSGWNSRHFADREGTSSSTNSDIIHSEVGTQTLSRSNSVGNDGKHIWWHGTADATWTFSDMQSSDSAFIVIENVVSHDLTLSYTGSAASATTVLEFGDLAVMQWVGADSRWYVYKVARPARGGSSVELIRANATYNATQTAALAGKILFCLSDAQITITLSDPGGSQDQPIFIRNFAPAGQRVILTTASGVGRSHEAYLTGAYDSAVAVWDDSVSRWEFTVTSRNHAVRQSLSSNTTFNLQTYWPTWRSNTVLLRTAANSDHVATIQPDNNGNWTPSGWEKGAFVEIHPLWSSGQVRLVNFKFARHNSDGRIEGFAKSTTARNATEGFGEPFRLVYDDYYVNTVQSDGSVSGELYQWHVMPLAQDVRAVIEDYDTTVAHKAELQAVEGKVDALVSNGDKTLTVPYWPLFNDPGSGSGWQAYEYNTAVPSGHSLKLEIAKGEHKVFFREYDGDGDLVKEFDLLRAFKDIGLYGDRDLILEGNAGVFLKPTIASNSVTAASLQIVADVYSGRILSPCPADIDVALTAGTILRAYGKKGTANPLTNGNIIRASGTATVAGIATAHSAFIVLGDSATLAAIRTLLYDGTTLHSSTKLQLVDTGGNHVTFDVTAYDATDGTGGSFNTALSRRGFAVSTPTANTTPAYSQSIRVYRDVGVPADWSREGATKPIPPDRFDSSVGQSVELFDEDFNLTTSMKRTSTTNDEAVRLPSDGLLWFGYGDAAETGYMTLPCRLIRNLNSMSVGDNPATGTDTAKLARQSTLRFRVASSWRQLTVAKDDSNYLLLGTVDSATAGDDPTPLKIWHIASGVTVDALSDVAGEVIATDTFTVPATGNIPTAQLGFSLDANAPSDAGYRVNSSGRNVYLGHVRRVTNHIGYLVQLIDPNDDDKILSECAFPLMQDESSKYGYLMIEDGTTNRATFRIVYDSQPGTGSQDNSNMWINETVLSRGTTFTATEVTVVIRELVVPAAQGGAQQSAGSSSGAFTTVSRSEFVRQAVSGTVLALGGSTGYEVDDEATHLRVEIAAPSDFTSDAFLYYRDPADNGAHIVYDADGDEVTVTGGNTTSYRFNSAFFHETSGTNYVKLELRAAATMVGSDLSIDIHHETDINSATVEPFDLISTQIRPPLAATSVGASATLAGIAPTEFEFANYVLYDDIVMLVIHMTSDNIHGREATDVTFNITKEELDYVREYTSFENQSPIQGWYTQGWMDSRGSPPIGPLRARPESEHVHWMFSASNSAPSMLFGYVKTGLYLKGLRLVSLGARMLIRKVACMRKI